MAAPDSNTGGKRQSPRWLRRLGVILGFIVIFVVGLTVLFYPQLSNYVNEKNASRVIANYDSAVDQLSGKDENGALASAQAYNKALFDSGVTVPDAFSQAAQDVDKNDPYWDLIDPEGSGLMGYITIDKIDVEQPIYHGTDDDTLSRGVGHLPGSSLPVGGESTHAVLSAHTGLPRAEFFTRLDELEEGDTFQIHILGETLTYQVDDIQVVLPTELDALQIVKGEDYVTLVTCTPYGINTHRLLVRGTRIPTPAGKDTDNQNNSQTTELNWFQKINANLLRFFGDVFEKIVTAIVDAADWVMDLIGVNY
jgi:sortase A